MASIVKKLSLLLFLLFFPFFSLQLHARKNHFFFNKITRTEVSKEAATPVREPTLVVGKDKPATTVNPESHHGYGLYGHLDESLPTTMTYHTELAGEGTYKTSKFSNEEFNQERYDETKEVWHNRNQNGRYYYDGNGGSGNEYPDPVDEFQTSYQDNQESQEEFVP